MASTAATLSCSPLASERRLVSGGLVAGLAETPAEGAAPWFRFGSFSCCMDAVEGA